MLGLTRHVDRRWAIAVGLLGMATTQALVAWAPNTMLLSAAVALWGIGSGVVTSLAEVALVSRTNDIHRTMVRWAFLGSVGDLLAPLLYAGCVGLGWSWRAALLIGALAAVLDAALIAQGPPLREADDEEDEEDAGGPRNSRPLAVWAWLLAATFCTFFDEILIAFGALSLQERGAAPTWIGVALAAISVGAAVGQLGTERLSGRFSPRHILLTTSVSCAVAWLLWLVIPTIAVIPAGFLVGLTAAPMWALCTANAYAAGGSPSTVAMIGKLFTPLDLLAPLLVGLAVDRFGLETGLLILLLQPLIVGAVALRRWR